MRKPDYTQLIKVLKKQTPDRPTLFEFFLNTELYDLLNNGEAPIRGDGFDDLRVNIYAYKNAGYDYVTAHASDFGFPAAGSDHKATKSLNEGNVIFDWATYETYKWPSPANANTKRLEACEPDMPEGMKYVVYGPGGVLENAISLTGYDNLCAMIYDEPKLAKQIFDDVGSRLVEYYELIAAKDSVCALISNDDWGFKTQTMLSPSHMRQYVFPWHKKIVEVGHKNNKSVLLHSCGMLEEVMDDIINDMGFDGKHSFEDVIMPIEDAYERYKGQIALLGGMDVDFVCTASKNEISGRAKAMLERANETGGYALGTGNSVPGYVPTENYLAMIDVVRKG